MPRSLLDSVDLRALRGLTTGGAASWAACLVDAGVAQLDPGDPGWGDRDRIVATAGTTVALERRLQAAGWRSGQGYVGAATGGQALGLAFGAGVASALDGAVWRAWCLLDEDACDDGGVWEVARAAADTAADTVGALVAGAATAALWRASGWAVRTVPDDEPVRLLGALDHALAVRGQPSVVLAQPR